MFAPSIASFGGFAEGLASRHARLCVGGFVSYNQPNSALGFARLCPWIQRYAECGGSLKNPFGHRLKTRARTGFLLY